jgi:hypothetical protein
LIDRALTRQHVAIKPEWQDAGDDAALYVLMPMRV